MLLHTLDRQTGGAGFKLNTVQCDNAAYSEIIFADKAASDLDSGNRR